MIHTIIESNMLLYVMAAAGALGIICQLFISRRYSQMIREASDTQLEKKDFMKQLRYRFQTNCKRSGENPNITVFVRRNLMNYRYRHLRLHQWQRLAGGFYVAVIAAAAAGLAYIYRTGMQSIHMQNLLLTAAGVTAATILVRLWTDIPYKQTSLQTELEDYLYHSGAANDYQEVDMEEPVQAAAKMPAVIGMRRKKESAVETKAQRDKRELKSNLAKIKEGARECAAATPQERERNREILRQMDSAEQERIIRDVLAEFLA